MTPEEELWAEAMAIEKLHGDYGIVVIAERIGALALAGDEAGVERWKAIGTRFDQLRAGQGSFSKLRSH